MQYAEHFLKLFILNRSILGAFSKFLSLMRKRLDVLDPACSFGWTKAARSILDKKGRPKTAAVAPAAKNRWKCRRVTAASTRWDEGKPPWVDR